MSVTIKTERQDLCGICVKLCTGDTGFINDDILDLLKFLIGEIDTSTLQNSPVCGECLNKIKEAYQFKNAHIETAKRDKKIELKQEYNFDIKFVMCYCCKNTVTMNSSVSLLDETNLDISNYLFNKEDLQTENNPQVCNKCQASLLNFQGIITLLSVYDNNKFEHDELDSEHLYKIDIDKELKDQNTNSGVDMIELKEEIKEEKMDSEEENDILCRGMQIKTEELILKSDYTEENSTEEEVLDHEEDTFKSSGQNEHNLNVETGLNGKYKVHPKRDSFIHQNTNQIMTLKCDVCDYETKFKGSLNQHSLIHKNMNEIEMFKCDVCDYTSKYKANVKQHSFIHKNMNEIEVFKCDICEYKTKIKYYLKRHSLVHKSKNEIEIYKCTVCDYETKYKAYMRKHLIVHKNINETEMFKCDICEYKTKFKGHLKPHSLVHKSKNEIKTFKCDVCEYETKYKAHLKQHLLIHSKMNETEVFKCDNCTYETKIPRNLKRHSLVHKKKHSLIHKSKDEEMFKCNVCDYQTNVKIRLKQHISIYKHK